MSVFATLFFSLSFRIWWPGDLVSLVHLEAQIYWIPVGKSPVMAASNPCGPRGASEFPLVVLLFVLGMDCPRAELPCALSSSVSPFRFFVGRGSRRYPGARLRENL